MLNYYFLKRTMLNQFKFTPNTPSRILPGAALHPAVVRRQVFMARLLPRTVGPHPCASVKGCRSPSDGLTRSP